MLGRNYMIDYGLKDRVAIITGANNPQGIGAQTALAFAEEGAKVVLVYKKIFSRRFKDLVFNTQIVWIGFICLSIINPSSFSIIYLVVFTLSSIVNNCNDAKLKI